MFVVRKCYKSDIVTEAEKLNIMKLEFPELLINSETNKNTGLKQHRCCCNVLANSLLSQIIQSLTNINSICLTETKY